MYSLRCGQILNHQRVNLQFLQCRQVPACSKFVIMHELCSGHLSSYYWCLNVHGVRVVYFLGGLGVQCTMRGRPVWEPWVMH